MLERQLRQMLVVEQDLTLQRLGQIFARFKTVRRQHIADPAIETLDHPICLRAARLGQSVFDAERVAQQIELMLAAHFVVVKHFRTVN